MSKKYPAENHAFEYGVSEQEYRDWCRGAPVSDEVLNKIITAASAERAKRETK